MPLPNDSSAPLSRLGRDAAVAVIAERLVAHALSDSPKHQASEILFARGTDWEDWLDLWVMRGDVCFAAVELYGCPPSECGYDWGGGYGGGLMVHFVRPAGHVHAPDVLAAAARIWEWVVYG